MRRSIFIILTSISAILINGCSSRLESPVINNDEGIISYSPKDSTGINAEIILYKGIDETTGLPLTAKHFTLGKKAKLYAAVKLLNRNNHPYKDLMIHFDWLDPDDNSFFKKRIDISSADPISELKSAITIQPETRAVGNYKFRVYLFRELIAEKNFSLVSYDVDSANVFSKTGTEKITADIILGSKYDKKTDIPSDTGDTFTLNDKGKIYAGINLLNKNLYHEQALVININWCDPNDSTFYSKRINFSPFDESANFKSSISINDKSRQPGKYKFKVFLYGNQIGEKSFDLVKEEKKEIKPQPVKGIESSIILCSRIDKKTKKPLGVSEEFSINDKAKIYSVISLVDQGSKTNGKSRVKVEWVGPDNNPFYNKIFEFTTENSSYPITSSISISPDKRKPGKYKCRVYFNSFLIAEKVFRLSSEQL
jgi:hypothetical protein